MEHFLKWIADTLKGSIFGIVGGHIIDKLNSQDFIAPLVGICFVIFVMYILWEIFFKDEPGKFNRVFGTF
jgi:hypothetical protein